MMFDLYLIVNEKGYSYLHNLGSEVEMSRKIFFEQFLHYYI